MANQFDDFDDDDTVDDGPANLRKALKRAEKERKALQDELNQFKAQQREQSIKSMLESEGVNAKIAKFIPSELSTPEQVKTWLTEYSDVFGVQSKPAPQDEQDDPRSVSQERMNRAINGAQSAPARNDDLLNKVKSATSLAELNELTGNQPARFQR